MFRRFYHRQKRKTNSFERRFVCRGVLSFVGSSALGIWWAKEITENHNEKLEKSFGKGAAFPCILGAFGGGLLGNPIALEAGVACFGNGILGAYIGYHFLSKFV